MFSKYRLLILGSLVWVVLDQWSKVAMAEWLVKGDLPDTAAMIRSEVHTVSETWFKFRVVGNPGAAWGMFRAFPDWARVPFFVVITSAALWFMLHFYKQARADQTRYKVALMCIFGGAIGNLIDRIRIGYVIDFVEWFYGDFRWPNFNVADIAISVGVGLLALEILFERKAEAETGPDAEGKSAAKDPASGSGT
jgi:signal peptidase II